jgi:hypothetical protein
VTGATEHVARGIHDRHYSELLLGLLPAAMLGRVSSLDFFVSLAFMPVSMAFAATRRGRTPPRDESKPALAVVLEMMPMSNCPLPKPQLGILACEGS